VLTGRVVVEEGAVIERSTVRGPVIIGRDTLVRDTYVGPFTSIYFGCTLEDTEIEHSIVLEESTIRGVGRIEDSLIGKQVEVSPSSALPRAHRLMLGDHSRVSIA
jgi:glucose-1-phosphate thymidylyltransferase